MRELLGCGLYRQFHWHLRPCISRRVFVLVGWVILHPRIPAQNLPQLLLLDVHRHLTQLVQEILWVNSGSSGFIPRLDGKTMRSSAGRSTFSTLPIMTHHNGLSCCYLSGNIFRLPASSKTSNNYLFSGSVASSSLSPAEHSDHLGIMNASG